VVLAVADYTVEKHGVPYSPQSLAFHDHFLEALKNSKLLPTKLEHFRQKSHPLKFASLVKCGKNLFLRSHFNKFPRLKV